MLRQATLVQLPGSIPRRQRDKKCKQNSLLVPNNMERCRSNTSNSCSISVSKQLTSSNEYFARQDMRQPKLSTNKRRLKIWWTPQQDTASRRQLNFVQRAITEPHTPDMPIEEDDFHEEITAALAQIQPDLDQVDRLTARHLRRVLAAFRRARVAPHHWGGSSGYGRGDPGRHVLEEVFSDVFGAESACVRSQFQSGTHAIACCLFGVLRPGQELLVVSGPPYDTLEEVIGQRAGEDSGTGGSALSDFSVGYRCLDLLEDGRLDLDLLARSIRPNTKCCHIQRSCGYTVRPSISLEDIAEAVKIVKTQNPDCVVLVDNCYGEFVEASEPSMVGADLVVGSLIKNPGGTIVPCGGYIVGKEELVQLAAARLSSPGVGFSAGATPGEWTRAMLQGFFLAPQMVGEARKGGLLVGKVMESRGFDVRLPYGDAVTSITFEDPDVLLLFCKAIMEMSPVNSFVQPIGGATPGYESPVVFADGTFIEGSTSEMSADGPIRPPYAAFCQGGTHWLHWAIALDNALKVLDKTK